MLLKKIGQENEELGKRIEKLKMEREDAIRDMNVVKSIGKLQYPKDC